MSEVANIRVIELPLKGDFQQASAAAVPITVQMDFDIGEIVYISVGRPTLAPRTWSVQFVGRSGDTVNEVLTIAIGGGTHAFRLGFAIEAITITGTAGVLTAAVWRTPPKPTEPGC